MTTYFIAHSSPDSLDAANTGSQPNVSSIVMRSTGWRTQPSLTTTIVLWYRITLLPLFLTLATLSSVIVVVVMLCAREVRIALSAQSRVLFSLLAACDVVRPISAAYLFFRMHTIHFTPFHNLYACNSKRL